VFLGLKVTGVVEDNKVVAASTDIAEVSDITVDMGKLTAGEIELSTDGSGGTMKLNATDGVRIYYGSRVTSQLGPAGDAWLDKIANPADAMAHGKDNAVIFLQAGAANPYPGIISLEVYSGTYKTGSLLAKALLNANGMSFDCPVDMADNYIQITEQAAPDAPDANKGRLFIQDDGAGKTQLAVRFPTGAVQVIATEP
jgi:hypothetical protein